MATSVLLVNGVSLRFGGVLALDDVSVALPNQGIVGLIGPNGAGKSTLFNVIAGHYKPDTGDITVDGKKVSGLPSWRVARSGIARTFQNPRVFSNLSVLENTLVGLKPRAFSSWLTRHPGEELARYWLDKVGLRGMEDVSAGSLSYGHSRQLEIARACATEPKVLLLDEPAAGMNAAETDALCGIVRDVSTSGIAVMLIEHDMKVVFELSNEVYVLNQGKVIASGSPSHVRSDRSVIEAYLGAGDVTEQLMQTAREEPTRVGEAEGPA